MGHAVGRELGHAQLGGVDEPGEYAWACGMNMLHGTLLAEPATGSGDNDTEGASSRLVAPGTGGDKVA